MDALLRFIMGPQSHKSPQHRLWAQHLPEQGLGKHIPSRARAEPALPQPRLHLYSQLPITCLGPGRAGDWGDSAPDHPKLELLVPLGQDLTGVWHCHRSGGGVERSPPCPGLAFLVRNCLPAPPESWHGGKDPALAQTGLS